MEPRSDNIPEERVGSIDMSGEDQSNRNTYFVKGSMGYDTNLLHKYLETSDNLIDYFVSYTVDNLEGLLKGYESQGNNFLQRIVDSSSSTSLPPNFTENIPRYKMKPNELFSFKNIRFQVLDRVPAIDKMSGKIMISNTFYLDFLL